MGTFQEFCSNQKLTNFKLKKSCFQGTNLCACFWRQTLYHKNKRKPNKN